MKIPDQVIDAFNQLIVNNFDGFSAQLKMDVETVFKRKWLDVELIFEQAGWEVEYDKAGYCETYESEATHGHEAVPT